MGSTKHVKVEEEKGSEEEYPKPVIKKKIKKNKGKLKDFWSFSNTKVSKTFPTDVGSVHTDEKPAPTGTVKIKTWRFNSPGQLATSNKEQDTRLPLGASHRVLWNLLVALLRSKEKEHFDIISWDSLSLLQFKINDPEKLTKMWATARNEPWI